MHDIVTGGASLTLGDRFLMVTRGKQPRAMLCLMIWKAPEIMAWLATLAASSATMKNACSNGLQLFTTLFEELRIL